MTGTADLPALAGRMCLISDFAQRQVPKADPAVGDDPSAVLGVHSRAKPRGGRRRRGDLAGVHGRTADCFAWNIAITVLS